MHFIMREKTLDDFIWVPLFFCIAPHALDSNPQCAIIQVSKMQTPIKPTA